MNFPADRRLTVLINHADPLLAMGLEAALRQETDIEVRLGNQRDEPVEPADVVVTDYADAMRLAGRGRKRVVVHLSGVPRVMAVTSIDREHEVRMALEQGVDGYVLLGCHAEEVIRAVKSLGRGMRYLCPSAAQRMAESLTHNALTPRETDVLGLLVQGTSDKAIARELNITLGTVKTHVRAILDKLGARCRTEAARIAADRGLITDGPDGRRSQGTLSDLRPHRTSLQALAA